MTSTCNSKLKLFATASIIVLFIYPHLNLSCITNSLKEKSYKIVIQQPKQVDFTQAELMLDFLKSLAKNKSNNNLFDAVLKAKGTDLIIKQMNLARKVSRDQYRQILSGLYEGKLPEIEPVDSSERAKRGVAGLTKNVLPALQWAIKHTDILEERLASLKGMDLFNDAYNLASKNLPEPVDMSPSLFVVMGGRAGFAALEDNNIYYDLLVMTVTRAMNQRPFITNTELIEFFAHEMHHIGLTQIIRSRRQTLPLDENQSKVFRFLTLLVEEGSASYLINGHRDLELMKKDPGFSNYLGKTDELLNTCETALTSILEGIIKNDEDYDKLTSPMLGNGFHSAGAAMLGVIDRVQGFDSIMEILKDPRLLLIKYNEAAGRLSQNSDYTFKSDLAENISAMGKKSGG